MSNDLFVELNTDGKARGLDRGRQGPGPARSGQTEWQDLQVK